MCNTIPEDENGVQQDINGPEKLSVEDALRADIDDLSHMVDIQMTEIHSCHAELDKKDLRIQELLNGIRYIASDMAALETDCAHDQCDAYVNKAKELMGWTR